MKHAFSVWSFRKTSDEYLLRGLTKDLNFAVRLNPGAKGTRRFKLDHFPQKRIYPFSSITRFTRGLPRVGERAQTFMNRLAAFFSAAWMGGATWAGCMRLAQARTKTRI
jgi:hypothetical protein